MRVTFQNGIRFQFPPASPILFSGRKDTSSADRRVAPCSACFERAAVVQNDVPRQVRWQISLSMPWRAHAFHHTQQIAAADGVSRPAMRLREGLKQLPRPDPASRFQIRIQKLVALAMQLGLPFPCHFWCSTREAHLVRAESVLT